MTRPTGRPRGRPRKDPQQVGASFPAEPSGALAVHSNHTAGMNCPRCAGGYLVAKVGQYGPFLSCSEFPVCRYSCRDMQIVEPAANTPAPQHPEPMPGPGAAGSGASEPGNEPGEPGEPSQASGQGQSEPRNTCAGCGRDVSNGGMHAVDCPIEAAQEPVEPKEPAGIPQQAPPPPFVPQSPIEQLIADIARKVAAGLDVEVLNTVRDAMEAVLANAQTAAPAAFPAAVLPAGMSRVKVPRQPQGKNSDIALAERIIKRMRSGPVMLVGPAGCGKSHICEVIANLLGLRFGGISFSSGIGEGVLIGRLIPLDPPLYLSTEFVDFFENGGLFLGDEMDAADPSVTLVLNQALANGRLPVPHRIASPYALRHAEFHMVCTMNTDGRGQQRNYAGRAAQDGAFLDRFVAGFIRMDYDKALELRLAAELGGTEEMVRGIWAVRERAAELGMHDRGVIISTRAVIRAAGIMRHEDATAAEAIAEVLVRFNAAERTALMGGAV